MKKFYSLLLLTLFGLLSSYAQTIDETFVKPVPYKAAKIAVIKEFPDGKILLGGKIEFYKGKKVNNLIRLNADYSLDETFVFNGDPKLEIRDAKFQSNGNIIVLMDNPTALAPDHYALHQLNSSGEILSSITDLIMAKSIAIQADDKILVTGGEIDAYGSKSCYLHRYNSDFSLDETFNNDLAFNASTNTVVVSTEGIYVGGMFTAVNGISKNGLVKLNSDGILDSTFDIGEGGKGYAFSLALQDDGKLLIGGNFFSTEENSVVPFMIRLNPDGTLDSSFKCQYGTPFNSKIFVKDSYIYLNVGINNSVDYGFYFVRLNSDGSLDESFSPAKLNELAYDFNMGFVADKIIYNSTEQIGNRYGLSVRDLNGNALESSDLQTSRFGSFQTGESIDGKLVVKGDFVRINDVDTFGIALMNTDGSFNESFVFPKYIGEIRQFQVVNSTTIFVSTKTKFLKLNNKGEVLKDFDFKKDSQIIEMSRFKVLENGKILVTDQWRLFRLNEDGVQETEYILNSDSNVWITGLYFELHDDKILCSGIYNVFNNGGYSFKMLRLNLDGSIDETFKIDGTGPDSAVGNIKILDSGEIILAGIYANFNGVPVPNQIVKLSKDGKMDLEFNENQKSGKIGSSDYHDYRKIEQLGSVLYITEGDSNVTAINLDGTFVKDFEMPAEIDHLSDIIALEGVTSPTAKSTSNSDNYIFAIGTSDNPGENAPSFIVKVNVGKSSGSLGLDPTAEKENSTVRMYPVPVKEQLNVTFSNAVSPQKIAVYSIEGKELYSAKAENKSELQVDMSKFAAGVYFIKLSSDSGVVTKKIIKR
ncbi:putative delta-60 repeat protein/predicted secreted protein (Por secretion system target) [Flavobacterium cutihirudinis]|uniref:Putative delta-60 repeat protein/predicted secreted protein (Por secretion system target) n=1 Tax=Flavobacterium cutihirudinis TaxID=1265740 RepID=A0A3D9G1H6_9FLAO|nr:T9SS type A sorting domain-containing protein [Flavobacterium cutihirudinis]RED26422.1 putative delta-60 repeat protein/predicted secreted protein (Por secretion system target) [Flavobacterium cutihirudinis]